MGKVKASKEKKKNNSLDRSLRVDCLDKMKGELRQNTINLDSYMNVNNISSDKIKKTRVKQSIVRQEHIVILNEKHHWVASK